MSPSRRLRVSAAVAAVCVVAPAVAPVLLAGTGARALEFVRTVPTDALSIVDHIVVDDSNRRVIVVGNAVSGVGMTVKAFDQTDLARPAGPIVAQWKTALPYRIGTGVDDPAVSAYDAVTGRLSLVLYPSDQERMAGLNPRFVVVALPKASGSARVVIDKPLAAFPPGFKVYGMTVSAPDRATLVAQVNTNNPVVASGAPGVLAAEIDPSAAAPSISARRGPYPVPGCQSLISAYDAAAVVRAGDDALVGCTTAWVDSVALPTGFGAVAVINFAQAAIVHPYFLPGSYVRGESYFDRAAGEQGRLVFVGAALGRPAQAVWVFDVAHRVVLGEISAGNRDVYAAGINASTGRVHVALPNAVLVASDRGRELPQAIEVTGVNPTETTTVKVLAASRLVLLRAGAFNAPWSVYRDVLPEHEPIDAQRDLASYDNQRSPFPEYNAGAQAYGSRVHEVGGVTHVLQNAAQLAFPFWRPVEQNTGLKDGDRDLRVAEVMRAHLGQREASAASVGARIDTDTISDLHTAANADWPYTTAECRDFGEGAQAATGTSPSNSGPPSVRCDAANGATHAEAGSTVASSAGAFTVGFAKGETTLAHTGNGMRVVARAEARDVHIAGTVSIGRVASTAEVVTAGTGSPGVARYIREFENVAAPGFSCTTSCDASTVLEQLTIALGPPFVVELPLEEAALTPAGAHGHAWRDPWGHLQDGVETNASPTDLQVPALRVSYVGDQSVPSRVILDLAATEADATSLAVEAASNVAGDPVNAGSAPELVLDAVPVTAPAVFAVALPRTEPGGAPAHPRSATTVRRGWRWLLAGGAGDAAVMTMLWLTVAAPLFLIGRRRHLLRLPRGQVGG